MGPAMVMAGQRRFVSGSRVLAQCISQLAYRLSRATRASLGVLLPFLFPLLALPRRTALFFSLQWQHETHFLRLAEVQLPVGRSLPFSSSPSPTLGFLSFTSLAHSASLAAMFFCIPLVCGLDTKCAPPSLSLSLR